MHRAHRSPVTDDVVARAVAGDDAARTELVRRHGPAVWGLARRMCPEPDDAYQEVWSRTFRALPEFDPDGPASFRHWLLTLTHRHLIDRHRRRTVRGVVLPLTDQTSELADPEHRAVVNQRFAHLEQALARLPEPHRRVILLHHLHGMPLADIATEEGVAVGTVKSRLHRARATLVAWMGARS